VFVSRGSYQASQRAKASSDDKRVEDEPKPENDENVAAGNGEGRRVVLPVCNDSLSPLSARETEGPLRRAFPFLYPERDSTGGCSGKA
jgi:hypothetical protein